MGVSVVVVVVVGRGGGWDREREGGWYAFVADGFDAFETVAEVLDVGPEGFDAFPGFFLLGGVELFFGGVGVVVDGAGEGG